MKSMSITSFITTFSFTLAIMLFAFACNEPNKKTNTKPLVGQPNIDLQTAIMTDGIDIVQRHIAAGTDINRKEAMSGSTPLITAATFGKTAIAKALIEANADLSIRNNDGATALHVAAFFCRVEIVQMLMDAKADKTIKNNFGATPRESVMGSFTQMKPFYEMLQQQLSPLGLQLDLNEIEKTRPVIAMMLE
ncbi:MAG: ankyrin repeat domain-containing protein [Bacteroidota bacterium]